MTPLLIPEDKLLDVPDEVLFAEVETILQELNVNLDTPEPSYSNKELDERYNEFLKVACPK